MAKKILVTDVSIIEDPKPLIEITMALGNFSIGDGEKTEISVGNNLHFTFKDVRYRIPLFDLFTTAVAKIIEEEIDG